MATARPTPFHTYSQLMDDIAKDISTPEKRAQVVTVLLSVAMRDALEVRLRGFAVEKLNELGVIEAAGPIKALAEQREWTDQTR